MPNRIFKECGYEREFLASHCSHSFLSAFQRYIAFMPINAILYSATVLVQFLCAFAAFVILWISIGVWTSSVKNSISDHRYIRKAAFANQSVYATWHKIIYHGTKWNRISFSKYIEKNYSYMCLSLLLGTSPEGRHYSYNNIL